MSTPGEFDPDDEPGQWTPGAHDEKEKKGGKPPKGKKDKSKKKKTKHDRENPDFEDIPGYESTAFGKNSELKPPVPQKGPSGDPPPTKFEETPKLSEEDCHEALSKFVKDQMCYGTKPAKEMKIDKVFGITALHYTVRTFTEARETKKKKKPYKGGGVDGPENGAPPPAWNIECEYKKKFKDDKIKKEVPHTAKVKKCKDCKGRGWETCDDCDGWGKVECETCDGGGRRETQDEEGNSNEVDCWVCRGDGTVGCVACGFDGRITCEDCEGYKKLKCFIQLKVKFTNHKDEYILETTDLPDELIKNVGGNVLFEQELPMLWPIQSYPVPEINENSKKLVSIHQTKWPNEVIRMQKHKLRGIPVTEVSYKWNDGHYRFWVYGSERKVYAPDYPQQCCCGCSII